MKKKRGISLTTVCKIGTLAHNTAFSARDFREYTGSASLAALVKRGVLKRTGGHGNRTLYYPTPRGWKIVERACGRR